MTASEPTPGAPGANEPSPSADDAPRSDGTRLPDFDKLAANAATWIEHTGRALSAYLKPPEHRGEPTGRPDTLAAATQLIGKVAEHWMSDPARAAEAQAKIAVPFVELWGRTHRRLNGERVEATAPPDKRFAAPEWSDLPVYQFLREGHAIAAGWAEDLIERSHSLDPHARARARFIVRQIAAALSPANFVATNPELMRQTLRSDGENLARGAALLAQDMAAGDGRLRLRQTDENGFTLGVDIAATPGKVVFRNEVMELLQYDPATPEVLRRPLLIVPPWINKFYILDLGREKSFVGWAVSQGLTVFMISWVNPDGRHRDKNFECYMREGLFAALDAVTDATGETVVDAAGYCIGGTLLATALAYMAALDDRRIASATFITAQTDFSDAGELKVFVDEAQLAALDAEMAEAGYLDGAKLAMTFNMMRPNELFWNYVVDSYVKGKTPPAFDLLYWNADSTRLPAANHSFYLRNFYLHNRLARGELAIAGVPLDLGRVEVPSYFLATREDHIAPAASVFRGARLFNGPVRFVLAGAGHTAGVINPPERGKYAYWTGGRPLESLEQWLIRAVETGGSWWPDWLAWLKARSGDRVPARVPGDGRLAPLGDAPGAYVLVRC